MGPAIYNCPGLTLDELPWSNYWGQRSRPWRFAELLIGGYTYHFRWTVTDEIVCYKLAGGGDVDIFKTRPGDILLAQALLIELTKGKTIQDPNL